MRASSNSLFGSPSFTIEAHKQEDGRFTASVPAVPEVGEATAATEREAITAVQQKLDVWVKNGCRQ